ncbi:MAG TPA: tripartite tricarboxylate transporter substrate binding protein [Pseudolabrys sp.]|jgi:tripartite-type tricarboxylate transporter receptor subunit TctC|nr:tripartite tricarboxylate transporter substrate binding protein [Pseudolabrys sp.]
MFKRFAMTLVASLILAAPAMAQTWPAKTVHVIVPFGPGSTPDVVARIVADGLKTEYPDSVFVVENKPGASGNLGTEVVAKAKPDGSTIGISIGGPLAINTLLFKNLPYNPKTDIAAVTQLITQASVLTVSPSLKVNTVAELIKLLKANPGKYNFASIGTGSLSQLAMEAIAIKSGTKIVHIAYKSSPQAILAVIRGEAQMAMMPAASVVPQAKADKVKMLAVSTAKRSPFLPKLPTLKETGIDVEADAWMGLIAPGGTPKAMVDKINRDVVGIIKSPAVEKKLATYLMEPVGSTPEQFRAVINGEITRWAPVIKAAHISKH